MNSSAVLSTCGVYRYRLDRQWNEQPQMGLVMLNPSTADASANDPTIRRCIAFARDSGHGGIRVINLFSLRSTDSSMILEHDDPIGPENARYLHEMVEFARAGGVVVAAWGKPKNNVVFERAIDVAGYFGEHLHALKLTVGGDPRHPLYLKRSCRPFQWQYACNEPTRTKGQI